MRIAVEGCSHGELDSIYATIREADSKSGKQTDVVLLCGDFQALRNVGDLSCLAVPDKYKQLGDFHRYYSGARTAPILTLVIGGNHEASNYMWELYHGGWLAPNIYYLGAAGCVDVGGLTIAGASGIYKSHDYKLGRFERMPYDRSTLRSIYHTREYDIFRLSLLETQPPAVFLSHDWPNTIEQHGDTAGLIRRKRFFKEEIESASLGSPPLMSLLRKLRPRYWFSAHLHVRFAALYKHDGSKTSVGGTGNQGHQGEPLAVNDEEINIEDDGDDDAEGDAKNGSAAPVASTGNQEEIDIDIDEDPPHEHEVEAAASAGVAPVDAAAATGETRFLALSKCLPGQEFLQILEVEAPCDMDDSLWAHAPSSESSPTHRQPALRFKPRWLAITRAMHPYLCLQKHQQPPLPPSHDVSLHQAIAREEGWLDAKLKQPDGGHTLLQGDVDFADEHPLAVRHLQRFVRTAPGMDEPIGSAPGPPPWYTNPQTLALCDWLEVPNRINAPPSDLPGASSSAAPHQMLDARPLAPPINEDEEIERIKAAAAQAMQRKRKRAEATDEQASAQVTEASASDNPDEVLILDDDEDGVDARWKEGTG